MKIEIIGDACAACHATAIAFKKAAAEIDNSIEVYITNDIIEIIKRGIIQMPAIIIDGTIISTGQHYTIQEAKQQIYTRLK